MRGQFENSLGTVSIDSEVVANLCRFCGRRMFWYRRNGSCQYERWSCKIVKKDYLHHGISVKIEENNRITLDFHVIVSYGVSISTVSDNLISTVKYKVEEFTGMKIEKINIFVEGVRVID